MTWKIISNNTKKHIVQNSETGEVRVIIHDQKYKEALSRGDFLQPVGKDKEEWLRKNTSYYENEKGEFVKK